MPMMSQQRHLFVRAWLYQTLLRRAPGFPRKPTLSHDPRRPCLARGWHTPNTMNSSMPNIPPASIMPAPIPTLDPTYPSPLTDPPTTNPPLSDLEALLVCKAHREPRTPHANPWAPAVALVPQQQERRQRHCARGRVERGDGSVPALLVKLSLEVQLCLKHCRHRQQEHRPKQVMPEEARGLLRSGASAGNHGIGCPGRGQRPRAAAADTHLARCLVKCSWYSASCPSHEGKARGFRPGTTISYHNLAFQRGCDRNERSGAA